MLRGIARLWPNESTEGTDRYAAVVPRGAEKPLGRFDGRHHRAESRAADALADGFQGRTAIALGHGVVRGARRLPWPECNGGALLWAGIGRGRNAPPDRDETASFRLAEGWLNAGISPKAWGCTGARLAAPCQDCVLHAHLAFCPRGTARVLPTGHSSHSPVHRTPRIQPKGHTSPSPLQRTPRIEPKDTSRARYFSRRSRRKSISPAFHVSSGINRINVDINCNASRYSRSQTKPLL